MFTISQIKQAHSKVKSGADFPAYIHEIIQLGVTGYETFVADGHTQFKGHHGFTATSESKYPVLQINGTARPAKFKEDLKAHQQGTTDYLTFCRSCAQNGVEKWIVDMAAMTCTYYDASGNALLTETIPEV